MLGELVGNYRIVSELAAGGMGIVYVAEHKHMGRRAAIKFLLPELSKKEDVINRFFDEARAASHVEHPGIVQIFDCDYDASSGRAYLVMELLHGVTLRQRLARRRTAETEETAITIATGIAEPLAAAHAKGIIHRDLKPENIFLVSSVGGASELVERVKILDFGVAKLGASLRGRTNSTLEGSVLGTPLYMSPEQCRGVRELDARADIYSLGCVLFEMLCGRPPFVGDSATALIAAHLCDAPPDPRTFAPHLSDRLAALLGAMLAKEAGGRPDGMGVVIERLAACRGAARPVGRGLSPGNVRGATKVLPTLPVDDTTASDPPAPARGFSTTLSQSASERVAVGSNVRSRRKAALLVVGAGAVMIGGLAVAALRLHPGELGGDSTSQPATAPPPIVTHGPAAPAEPAFHTAPAPEPVRPATADPAAPAASGRDDLAKTAAPSTSPVEPEVHPTATPPGPRRRSSAPSRPSRHAAGSAGKAGSPAVAPSADPPVRPTAKSTPKPSERLPIE